MDEINRVRKRRAEREQELEEMERLRTEEQRLRESCSFGDWQKKEVRLDFNTVITYYLLKLFVVTLIFRRIFISNKHVFDQKSD